MLSVLLITFPFFALVLCGYLAARSGTLPQAAIPGLNAFVLFFALPCMLFRFGSSTPIAQLLDPAVAGVYVLCALVMVGGTVALTRARMGWNDAAFGALVAAFPNTGFMGVPLLVALLGAQAAGPVIVTIAVDMVVITSVCVALSRLDSAGTHGVAVALRKALRGMVSNPMPWAIALAKLLLHPLLVWLVGLAAIRMGAPLTPFAHTALVLAAALPSASNVSLLAERFGAHNGRIARIILVSTALAFLSFSVAVAWLV